MAISKRWYGPRTTFSDASATPSKIYQFGDCTCCGCLSQSGTDSVADTDLDPEAFYPRFTNGVRLKIIMADLPSYVTYELAGPIINESGNLKQSVTTVAVSGLDQFNGTRLVSLPVSQYGCLWPRRFVYTEAVDLDCSFDVVTRFAPSGDCGSAYTQTESRSSTIPVSINVGVYRRIMPLIETAAGGSGSPFRYVLTRIGQYPCFFAITNDIFNPYLGMVNAYWPFFAADNYRLDSGINDGPPACTTGLAIDGKRIANIVSGVFSWQEVDPISPAPDIANDATRTASLCGLTGGADVSGVTGTVGSYSIEIERL